MKYLGYSKSEWSWAFFDWANSAFATTVMAGLFPIFFKTYYAKDLSPQDSTFYLGLTLSISSLIVAIFNPLLGFLSDKTQKRKVFSLMSSCLCLFGLLGLTLIYENEWHKSLIFYGFCLIGFQLALSFYDSLLTLISKKERQHQVSALGYSLGYLGGGLLFFINILMVEHPQWFGFDNKIIAVKMCFVSVFIWWILFSLPYFFFVKEAKTVEFKNILSTFKFKDFYNSTLILFTDKKIKLFLLSYWLFIDAVYTIIHMATDYGTAIGLPMGDLIKALLLVQFLGFPFSFLSGKATLIFKPKNILLFLLSIYFIAIFWAIQMTSPLEFWILAGLIAMAQGGVQSLSRSLFSELVPSHLAGEYFGFFNLVGRFASLIGPLIVGGLTLLTQSNRLALLGLLLPLMAGWIILYLIPFSPKVSKL